MSTPDPDRCLFTLGQHVRHVFSGWHGHVVEIRRDDSPMAGAQGALVKVAVEPHGTSLVTADELERWPVGHSIGPRPPHGGGLMDAAEFAGLTGMTLFHAPPRTPAEHARSVLAWWRADAWGWTVPTPVLMNLGATCPIPPCAVPGPITGREMRGAFTAPTHWRAP